ncbi:uncharacterized protein LOC127080326 [Lathyrus oleraceus]|uniref:uncharacterized protein LOC127080326 n=1 Tax=Pisum sativum TaxID=3888 RepID=UPI0021D0AFFA|nr:uncharacterized protein LOC127080326 [Pisum sativum]
MQKGHTNYSEHEDEEEKNAPVEGEVDKEMQDADDIVEDISDDGSPKITNPNTDSLDDKEEEDQSMSYLLIEPIEDEDEKQDHEPKNEQIKDIPMTKITSDGAKRTTVPSTENTDALSSEELEALKKSKPVKYLKAIIIARGSSIEKSPSTSTVSGGQSTIKSGDELLLKIKENSFDVDLLQLLENDTTTCFGIKDLLKQADILNASLEVADIIMDLGLMIDQVVAELNRIREASNKIHDKLETQAAEWDATAESIAKVAELEKGSEKNKKEVEAYDKNIQAWEQ